MPGDGRNAPALLSVEFKDFTYDLRLTLLHRKIRLGVLGFPDVTITVRRRRKHVDQPFFGPVTYAPTRALGDLRPLILRDHALELEQQALLRRLGRRRFDKHRLHSTARKFLDQQHLVSILATEPVGSINQHNLNLPFGRQVAEPLQGRPGQHRPAVALVLKNPFWGHHQFIGLGVL